MSEFTSSKRSRKLNDPEPRNGKCVIYLMSRDQRAQANWALLEAQAHAQHLGLPLIVTFIFYKGGVKNAQARHYRFMLEGLRETAEELDQHGIPFVLYHDDYQGAIKQMVTKYDPAALYCDYSPLRGPQTVRRHIAKAHPQIPSYTVDAHNVIPVWITSQKQEWAAYTIRPKIHKLLKDYLTPYPALKKQSHPPKTEPIDWEELLKPYADAALSLKSGAKAAAHQLQSFVKNHIQSYDTDRNDATADGQSGLSPYLHFGHISAQYVAHHTLEQTGQHLQIGPKITQRSLCVDENVAAFLEELIVRRELSDNFCTYNKQYDTLHGAPDWARETLAAHAKDTRDYTYSYKELEQGKTHDQLWNAAQLQMVREGKMHGYLRMYWAKKILEWTPDAATAITYAVQLNDTYEMDGRDPNGYVGILWSIAGLHDRPWFERDIYGTVRYMAESGAKKKFDIEAYIKKYSV